MKKIIFSVLFFMGIIAVSFTVFSRGGYRAPSPAAETNALQALFAPDFSLPKLGGGIITLSDYRGKKPVILDFWASWCPNCRRDMPKMDGFYQTYKDRVEIIGINLAESENDVRAFIASKNITFPIILDAYGEAARLYRMNYTNVHVFIGQDGRLVKTVPGDIRESDIRSIIR